MTFSESISNASITLKGLGFNLRDCKDLGLHKHASFTNGIYDVYFSYTRGSIEFIAHLKNGDRLEVISLINWLYKNPNRHKHPEIGQFADDGIIKFYADIFSKDFELINQFLTISSEKEIKAFKDKQLFDVAKYWSKVFSDKGKPIPDTLREIIERGESF
jgi:hypothetical protein